jgi:hypothetical protein
MPSIQVRAHTRRGRPVREHERRHFYAYDLSYDPESLAEYPLYALRDAYRDVRWSRMYEGMAPSVEPEKGVLFEGRYHSPEYVRSVQTDRERQRALTEEFARRGKHLPRGF